MMTIKQLKEFCEKNDIWVPPGATKAYLEAAVVRAAHQKKELKGALKTCFGCWENENSDCMVCDYEVPCFHSSIGMEKETFFKKLKKIAGGFRL